MALVIQHSKRTKDARQCYCLSFVYPMPSREFYTKTIENSFKNPVNPVKKQALDLALPAQPKIRVIRVIPPAP
jgi:hypothetical protein